jgi:hypothetical protein
VDDLDQTIVDVEGDVIGCPLGRIPVRRASVDRDRLRRELIRDRGVAERVHAHPDSGNVGPDVPPEDLADADLGRPLGSVLEADHPEGDHVRRVVDRASPQLEQAIDRGVQGQGELRLAHDETVAEALLTDAAAEVPGERPGLQRRHPHVAIDARSPRRLVRLDPQAKAALPDRVSGRRRLSRAPVRQVVRQPQPSVEGRPIERVLDLELVSAAIEARGRLGPPLAADRGRSRVATRHRRDASRS